MRASVIVTMNPHEGDPAALVAAFCDQCLPASEFEVVMLDNGVRDDVMAELARHLAAHPDSNIRVLPCARPGRAAGNNEGARAARSDLLIFLADDFIPCPTLVSAHIAFHAAQANDASVGIGPGFFVPALREDPFRRWMEDTGRLYGVPFRTAQFHWDPNYFYVGNCSMQRSLWVRAGGFSEEFAHDLNDDFEFALRMRALGVRSHYLPKAGAWHDHTFELEERLRAERRMGESAHIFERLHAGMDIWSAVTALPPPQSEARVQACLARFRETGLPEDQAEYFRAAMQHAFIEGYAEGKAKDAGAGRAA